MLETSSVFTIYAIWFSVAWGFAALLLKVNS